MGYLEMVEQQLDAISQHNEELRALITPCDRAMVLELAREAAEAWNNGRWLGPLHGMTISVKDNIDTAGTLTTAGAKFLANNVPGEDATVVKRLKEAGAIIIGKANMNELAFGVRSYSSVGGQCRNPVDPRRIPGGSSGGSGASVAAGMCTASLGTDTGGSVRLPAAFNGVAGLRPTHGVVSNAGVLPVSELHDTVGPMARHVIDVARVFSVLAGFDERCAVSVPSNYDTLLARMKAGVAGLKIGVPSNHYFDACSNDVASSVENAIRVLEKSGAQIIEVSVPMAEHAQEMLTRHVFADMCLRNKERLDHSPEDFDSDVYRRMIRGRDFSAVDYAEAQQFKRQWQLELRTLFSRIDILASPASPVVAPLIEEGGSLYEVTRDLTRNTYAGALGGIPGLSVPCGTSSEGMPIGLQLEAGWQNEALLFAAGHVVERSMT